MKPKCTLEDYQLIRFAIDWHNPEKRTKVTFQPCITYGLRSHKKDAELFQVEMHVNIVSEEKPPAGYEVHAGIRGQFRVPSCGDVEKQSYIATLNGLTILYGILRGHVAAVSGSFSAGKFLLPTVMMQDVIAASAPSAPPSPETPVVAESPVRRKKSTPILLPEPTAKRPE
jgi:hypothetical protein